MAQNPAYSQSEQLAKQIDMNPLNINLAMDIDDDKNKLENESNKKTYKIHTPKTPSLLDSPTNINTRAKAKSRSPSDQIPNLYTTRYLPINSNFDESDYGSDEELLMTDRNIIETLNSYGSTSTTPTNVETEEHEKHLKIRLRYYFMTPCQKWKFRGRKPFKLSIQVLKIILITCQVIIFGILSMKTSTYTSSNLEAFRTLFLTEDLAKANLPDGTDGLALAHKSIFYHSVNHARRVYAHLDNENFDVFGTEFTNNTMKFCMLRYTNSSMNPSNGTYNYDPSNIQESCYQMVAWTEHDSLDQNFIPIYDNKTTGGPANYPINQNILNKVKNLKSGEQLIDPVYKLTDLTVNFQSLINAHIHFNVRTIRLKNSADGTTPDWLEHRIKVHYENSLHSGIIGYHLSAMQHYLSTNANNEGTFQSRIILYTILDIFCLCLCIVSFILCSRGLIRGRKLGNKFTRYFITKYGYSPSYRSQFHFINFWYIAILVSDILIIIGSMIKMDLENKWIGIIDYSSCQLLLGIGIGITWIGLIRYIGFFSEYNIMVSVLKASLPHCFKFFITSSILYTGFALCGWLVLGPYNIKFRTLIKTSESLFSLINGDDMFNTFEVTSVPEADSSLVVFNQVYLYSFISIFIYVVLNLFLAIILETFDTIKEARGGTRKLKMDELEKFIGVSILNSGEPIRLN